MTLLFALGGVVMFVGLLLFVPANMVHYMERWSWPRWAMAMALITWLCGVELGTRYASGSEQGFVIGLASAAIHHGMDDDAGYSRYTD